MNSSKQHSKPQFTLYPKRKSVDLAEASLYLRVSFQFSVVEKSMGIKIPIAQWNGETHQLLGNPFQQKQIDEISAEIKEKVMGAYYLLSQNGSSPTLREIMDMAFAGEEKKTYTLFAVFHSLLLKMARQNTLSRQQSNLLKHQTCLKHLKAFVKQQMQISDISFNRINRHFIDEFEIFLRTEAGNNHNSTMKLLQIFKKVYRIAVDNRWTSNNAFSGKRLTYKDVDIEVLSEKEIKQLRELVLEKGYLQKTRNLFLFCIHTGLSYIDLQQLKRKHIEFNPVSNQYLIRKKREKTEVEFIIPLFCPAQQLLEQWIPNWECLPVDHSLAPKISNQKYNVYLKELFALLQIQKKITTHVGRHTFATTVALENGVPIETVSKMLGHSKISQTQKYAKVTALKVERETKELFNLLKNKA